MELHETSTPARSGGPLAGVTRQLAGLLVVLLAGVFAGPAGCSSRAEVEVPGLGVRIIADDGSGAEYLELDDAPPRDGQPIAVVRGHEMRVADGTLWIGDRSYGPIERGSVVELSARAVFVDGHRRGELPALAP